MSHSDLSLAKLNSAHLNEAILIASNLHKADLRNANLRGANLKHSDLSGAFLHKTQIDQATYLEQKWFFVWTIVNQGTEVKKLCELDLRGVNFSDSDLSYVDFSGSNLSEANLSGVNLRGANLSRANLRSADLHGANLLEADLREANLRSAQLNNADLSGWDIDGNLVRIDLKGADLSRACLFEAYLFRAKLFRANLREADLRQAYLVEADLVRADLSKACLEQANLTHVQAVETNFSEARLTGACLEDWSINQKTKLDGVICDYVYKKDGQNEHRPRSGKFAAGEFTALFQKAIETVDLIFIDGVDWQAFLQSFQELRKQYGEKISVQAIEKKSYDAFIIRSEVAPEVDKVALEEQHRQLYVKLSLMHEKVTLQDEQLIFYREQIAHERQKNSEFPPIIQTLAENQRVSLEVSLEALKAMAAKEDSRTVNTGGGNYIESNSGTYVEGNFISMSQDLAQAASQIQDLIEQLQKQGVTVDVAQEQVANGMATEAKKDLTMKDKLVKWGQSLGSATLSDVVKGAVRLAIRSTTGIQLP